MKSAIPGAKPIGKDYDSEARSQNRFASPNRLAAVDGTASPTALIGMARQN
jgi:hypothetical protein